MPLYLDTGHSCSRGDDRSEKSCLIVVPNAEHEAAHGALLAIADGLPEHPNPEDAALDTLKALGQAFYAAPENWSLSHALQESVFAANKVLLADQLDPGRASALSSLVLRGRRWAIAHAGHTRVWLVRDSKVKVLTRDHVEPRLQRAPRVTRACGLTSDIETEFVSSELRENDVFILTTAGIHDVLTGAQILACVMLDMTAAQMASMVTGKVDSADNIGSVCVVRVEQLPAESQTDIEEDITALPAVPPPDIGSEVDGFRIERLVHKSSRYRLYKAIDTPSGQIVALKFPNPRDAENNPGFAESFLREEWIGRRVSGAHLVRTLALKKGRRTVLYSVMAYPRGESLAKALARKGTLGVRASVFTGTQLLEALGELHHQGIIHNDIRPQNIVIDKHSKNLILLGLGGSHLTRTTSGTETSSGLRRGSFLAPEMFEPDIEPTLRTDIFSAGVTIYRMLSGTYPYGKILRNGQAPRGAYVPVTTYCAEASPELDDALRRACALDAEERFESAHEFVQALEQSIIQSNVPNARAKPGKTSPRVNWELVLVGALLLGLLAYIVLSF